MDNDRIVSTHVGSLVRPPQLAPYLRRIERRESYDERDYERCLADAVAEVVRRQRAAGIDVVSDGEFGKPVSWSFYVHERLGGIEFRDLPARPTGKAMAGADRNRFAEFYAEYDSQQELNLPGQWVCTGPVSYRGHDVIRRDVDNLRAAVAACDADAAFLPVVSPGSAFPWWVDEHYGNDQDFLIAVADAMREEYRAIVDAGLFVQIDDAFLTYMYDLKTPEGMTMSDYRTWAANQVDIVNHALDGIPEEKVRFHICWGSWNGPHTGDVPLRDVIDLVLKVRAGSYLFEAANPRHAHEWRIWEDVKLPPGKKIIPGVVSHATNVVEHPELVAQRLGRFAELVGPENVGAGTDCGFAQGPFVARVHPSIVWAKLEALSEGARLATAELFG